MLDIETLFLLFFAAIAAGTIDAIAGGGGLITLPALLLSGLPPLNALGTNKSQSMAGTLVAAAIMVRKKIVNLADLKMNILYVAIGSALGTLLVQWIDRATLEFLIPVVLILVTLYTVFSPKASDIEAVPRMEKKPFLFVNGATGFYDGILGPGTGSIFALTHVGLRGMPIKKATGCSKVLNLISNIASFTVFLIGGHIIWTLAAVMICGQLIGGFIGAHLVILKGTSLIKPLIGLTSMAMIIKYFFFS